MRYFLGLMRLERINFFLFGFAIFYIVVSFIFSIKNDSSSTIKSISADVPFNQTDYSGDTEEES